MNLTEIKLSKLLKNLNNSYLFYWDVKTKEELISYLKTANEPSLDVFSSIYNLALEKYEKLEKKKIYNIHKTNNTINLLTKKKIEEISILDTQILEKQFNLL